MKSFCKALQKEKNEENNDKGVGYARYKTRKGKD